MDAEARGPRGMPSRFKFALQESFSESRTVDCNQRFLGSATVPMNCPGYELLASSSFPHKQDGCIRGGNAGDLLAHFVDFGAVPEDGVGPKKIPTVDLGS